MLLLPVSTCLELIYITCGMIKFRSMSLVNHAKERQLNNCCI
jgi:hypothetical protein